METLDAWMSAVADKDMNRILNLYDDKAVLVATFSDTVRTGEAIRDYFDTFLQKHPKPSIRKCYTTTLENCTILNGLYNFTTDDAIVCARFTFVVQHGQIIAHHSSKVPNNK